MSWVLTLEEVDEAFDEAIMQAASRGESLSIEQIKMFAAARSGGEWNEALAKQNSELNCAQATQAPSSRKRGRPAMEREPEYEYKVAMARESVPLADTDKWGKTINRAVACRFPEITEVQRMTLVPRLVHAAGHYTYGKDLRAIQDSKTNKIHTEKQVLIYECAKAWEAVTGETLTVWYAPDSTILQEPTGVKLARTVAASIGRPLVGDVRRHAAKARKMLNKDKE